MPCPICGANCQCKNRGPAGLCCDCHRHKPRSLVDYQLIAAAGNVTPQWWQSYQKHVECFKDAENVKTLGEAMAKKDARNKIKESGSWRPHEWREERRREYTTHMLAAAFAELSWWVGEYHAGVMIAETRRDILEAQSVAALKIASGRPAGVP